eukprot:scaffold18777_cov40-Attheya_sp.AAC.2
MSKETDPPLEESTSWTFLHQPSQVDTAGLVTPPSLRERPSSGSTSLGGVSGESLGSDGGGGVGTSDPLLPGEDATGICYEYMNEGQMFCVREVKVGHKGCRYHTNINEEARMPFLENQVYICTSSEGGLSAWVSPSVSVDPLNEVMLDELRQVSRSRSGWNVLMTVIREESQDKVDDALLFGNGAVPLQVPKTAKKAKQMPRSLNRV